MSVPRKTLSLLILLLLLPALAWAAPKVVMSVSAEKEVTIEQNGQPVTTTVPADEISPGETLIYTLNYANQGDEDATAVTINNPVPDGTAYVPGSATEAGIDLAFSIDGGKTFNKPTLLTYEVQLADGSSASKVAAAEDYTHIRWVIPRIATGASGALNFEAKVK